VRPSPPPTIGLIPGDSPVPGLALLVPGSFGLRSLDSLLAGQSVTGVEQGFQMFMMTMALVAGLLFSNTIVVTEANA